MDYWWILFIFDGILFFFVACTVLYMSVFTIDAAYCFSTAQTNPLDQTMRFSLGFDLDGMRDLFGKMKRRR